MPASRSARAITFAPRSWPSSPGFAMTTLSLRIRIVKGRRSDDGHFLVLAPDVAERVAHLADGGVGADGVDDARHQVLGGLRGRAQTVERALHRLVVARPAQLLELCELCIGRRFVDV